MEELRRINGPGIDTKQERDQINYHPNIQPTKPVINTGYLTEEESIPHQVRTITTPKMVNTWTRAVEVLDMLDELDEQFSQQLKNAHAQVSDRALPLVVEAGKKLGVEVVNGKVPFDLYKKALHSIDSHEKIIVMDAFENYQADINGDIAAELYPDVVEMKEDWSNIIEFIKNGIFQQLVSPSELPKEVSKLDPALAIIQAREKELGDRFIGLKKICDEAQSQIIPLNVSAPDSEEFSKVHKIYKDAYRMLTDIERRIFTKNESMSLIETKLNDAIPLIKSIDNATKYEPYKGNTHDILYRLLLQYSSGQMAEKGLRRIQALLKLSIDGKIENVDNTKANIRGIVNNQSKKNVNRALVGGIHLKNEVFGDVLDTMDNFESAPENPIFDMVAGHIVDSVARSDTLYGEQSSDFHKIHSLDSELRREKLDMVIDKDTARRLYNIIEKLISYAQEGNRWPQGNELSSWLRDFVNSEGLS